jgi:hypothetical protein
MKVTVWKDSASEKVGKTYGFRILHADRAAFFALDWIEIDVEIEGQVHRFELEKAFWTTCPEFRDRDGTIIREWLERNRTLTWEPRKPPKVDLLPLGSGRFRLQA